MATVCSSADCDHLLSRYNKDPDGRCNVCQQKATAAWLVEVNNPHGTPHSQIRQALRDGDGPMTAVQIERATKVPVEAIYRYLIELVKDGEVIRERPKRRLAVYYLTETMEVAA